MGRQRSVDVQFPLGGENRAGRYAQQGPIFTTPRAANVRSRGPLERRGRGGSRPGLTDFLNNDFGTNIVGMSHISYIDDQRSGSGTLKESLLVIADGDMVMVESGAATTTIGYFADSNGDHLIDGSGDALIEASTVAAVNPIGNTNAFEMVEHGGKVYIAGSSLEVYDPDLGTVEAVANAPANQPLVTIWKERIILGGLNHIFWIGRQGDFTDWTAAFKKNDVGQAVFGQPSDDGKIAQTGTFFRADGNGPLIIGTNDTLWIYEGDAYTGRLRNVSKNVGIISNRAAVIADDLLVFLSRTGLHTWPIGSNKAPEPWSDSVIPDDLRDIDPTSIDVNMVHDQKNRGVWLFLTPASTDGEHWWLDLTPDPETGQPRRALWPVTFATTNHQPLSACVVPSDGDSDVLVGCKDGYVRYFKNSATTDDGATITSDIGLGPFHVSGSNKLNGMVDEMLASFANTGANITWKLLSEDTAEEVVDRFEATLDGDGTDYDRTGTWTQDRNWPEHTLLRGAWCMLWLRSTGRWSFESLTMIMRSLGRLK